MLDLKYYKKIKSEISYQDFGKIITLLIFYKVTFVLIMEMSSYLEKIMGSTLEIVLKQSFINLYPRIMKSISNSNLLLHIIYLTHYKIIY